MAVHVGSETTGDDVFFLFQGNKKGPLGRWDFDTQEEYSDYMNNKEALPKFVLFIRHLS